MSLRWANSGCGWDGGRETVVADCRQSVAPSVVRRSLKSTESCSLGSVDRIVGVECSMYTSRQLGNLGSGPARRQRQREKEEEWEWNGGHIF